MRTLLVHIIALLPLLGPAQQDSRDLILDPVKHLFDSGRPEAGFAALDSMITNGTPEEWEDVYIAIVYKANRLLAQGDLRGAFTVLDQGVEIATRWQIAAFEVQMRNYQGQTLKIMGDNEAALHAFREVLSKSAAYPEHSSILQEYAILKYQMFGDTDSSRFYLDSALAVAHRTGDSLRITSALEAVGQLHLISGSFLAAADAYIEAIPLVTRAAPLKKFTLLHNVAQLFLELGQLDKARDYGQQALTFAENRGYRRSTAMAQNTLGAIAYAEGSYEEAITRFEVFDAHASNAQNSSDFVSAKVNLAAAHFALGHVEEAERLLSACAGQVDEAEKLFQCRYHREMGRIALDRGNAPRALQHFLDAEELSIMADRPLEQEEALRYLQLTYERLGDYQAALEASKERQAISDSLFQIRQAQLIYENEARYRKAEQDKLIARLNADNEIKDIVLASKNKQLALGAFGLLALGVIALLVYRSARIRKRNNRLLAEKNALISHALEEKELLLREIHHRVKNNLQVVSSLLSLQSQFIEDEGAQEAIKEGRDRVKSMALIHQNLYQEDNLTGIEIKAYFEKLIHGLFHSYNIAPSRIELQQNIEEINLDVDTVIPLGLIVNELVSNALKYAFPDGRQGLITVSLHEEDQALVLEVTDDGIGMDRDWTQDESDSFGYRLIHAFKDKLEAELQVSIDRGTAIRMQIHDYQKAG